MTRFDAMQSNHPQANAPWAGQTQSSGPGTDRGGVWPRRLLADVDRGAPLVVMLLILVAAGVWVALIKLGVLGVDPVTYFPATTLTLIVYLIFGRRWETRLWRTRWEKREPRDATPEAIAMVVLVAAVVGSVFVPSGVPWASLSLLGLQAAVLAVITPLTLRRYPGLW